MTRRLAALYGDGIYALKRAGLAAYASAGHRFSPRTCSIRSDGCGGEGSPSA
jgi:hypothetical protein